MTRNLHLYPGSGYVRGLAETAPERESLARPAPRFAARLHAGLDAVAPLWRRMEEGGTTSAYQRLDWVRGLLARIAGPAAAVPLFVEVSEGPGGRPVMIVPLALVRRRGCRVVTALDLGVCDYAAPVLAAGVDLTAAETAAAWAAMRAVLPAADMIHLSRIPAEIHGRRNPLAAVPGVRRMIMQASGVALDGDPATLLDRLCRPSVLKDLGKQRRRLDRAGRVGFSRAETPAAVDALFAVLVEQRRRRFGEIGRFDLLARPEIHDFYRAAALDGLAGGPARLLGLWVDGTCIAAAYGLVHRDTFHGLLLTTTSEERWRNASPGVQVVSECLRWARGQGLAYFDFTVGDLPYKRDFGVASRDLDEILCPLTVRGRVLALGLRTAEASLDWLQAHPAAYGRVQKLRRRVRKAGFRAPPDEEIAGSPAASAAG